MSRSIQQFPATSSSTSVVEVATNTGFTAGDLVYYQNGDYKGAPNLTLPSSANFPATQTLPTNPNDWIYSTNAPGQGINVYGGSVNKGSAVLSNGNVVQAFASPSQSIYFRIIDVNNTNIVSATLISNVFVTNSSCSNVGVLALTSGNFVVYWVNASGGSVNRLCYAIYTNAGASVVAAVQDTTLDFAASTNNINGVALPNGGWVIAGGTSTSSVIHRGYTLSGSTVTATYAATTLATLITSQAYVGIAARSDSSFIIIFPNTGSNYLFYLYSSVGAAITNSNIATTAGVTPVCDVSILSNGTTFVLAYKNSTAAGLPYPAFRFLPTGNVLGSEFAISVQNINGGQTANGYMSVNVLGLSNGNLLLTFADYANSTNANVGFNYAVFNSSGTAVIATNSNGVIPIPINSVPIRSHVPLTLLETSTSIFVCFSSGSRSSTSQVSSHYFKFSKTDYTLLTENGVSATVGSSTAGASGLGYGRTTPSAIAVSAATTGTVSVQTNTSYTLPPSILYASQITSSSAATLPNGNFLIAYKDYVTYVVYVSVFTPLGNLLQTITVGAGYATVAANQISVCALSSGKFVVSYCGPSSGTVVINAMYSSSYSLINTSTLSTTTIQTTRGVSSAGLSNDRFVIATFDTNAYPSYYVFDNTNTSIASAVIYSTACNGLSVVANDWGGFYVQFWDNASTLIRIYGFYNTTGNTYTQLNNTNTTGSGNNAQTKLIYSNGTLYGLGYNGGNYVYSTNEDLATGMAQSTIINAANQINSSFAGILGVTGLGNPLLFYPSNTSNANNITGWTNSSQQSGSWSTAMITYPNNSFLSTATISYSVGFGSGLNAVSTPGIGNNVVLAWADTSGFLQYAIANVIPVSASTTVTAGTSSSLGIVVSPVTSAVNSSVVGGVFSGVAATTATAGSTGQVIVNGAAQLNANYTSTSSGVVDHQGAGVNGVRGTFNGRLINMQGNT
tara:strand:+ start:4534 stop:7413 length:2880 start_codon:yes stop_codon:yes gene_type:complete